MKVTMKLFASLANCLPAGAVKNQVDVETSKDATILELLDHHSVPRGACHLVLLNGVFQAPSSRGRTKLTEGDVVAVWPPVAGG